MKINQNILDLLNSEFFNIDFKSGNKLVKCKIEILEDMLLVTDGRKEKYLVNIESIEKISTFKNYLK